MQRHRSVRTSEVWHPRCPAPPFHSSVFNRFILNSVCNLSRANCKIFPCFRSSPLDFYPLSLPALSYRAAIHGRYLCLTRSRIPSNESLCVVYEVAGDKKSSGKPMAKAPLTKRAVTPRSFWRISVSFFCGPRRSWLRPHYSSVMPCSRYCRSSAAFSPFVFRRLTPSVQGTRTRHRRSGAGSPVMGLWVP